MTSKLALVVACAALAACSQMAPDRGAPGAAQGATAAMTKEDVQFMEEIARANIAEIQAGKLALARAESPVVRQFAQRMIDDHTMLLDEGGKLAKSRGMPVPAAPGEKHQEAMRHLQTLQGASFDRAYMQHQVRDHLDSLYLLKRASSQAKDPQLRQHAQKAIPIVQQHLRLAEGMTGS